MDSETNSLLNVPITDAERRARLQSRGEHSRSFVSQPQNNQHERDRQFTRFSSLRHPGERYDDPEQPYQNYSGTTTGSSTLPNIEEENLIFSEHEDDVPIIRQTRSSTFPRTNQSEYAPLPELHNPQNPKSQHSQGLPLKLWQPVWLRKLTLALVATLLLVLIAGLVATCNRIDSDGGFRVSSTTQHYAWTYLPTVVLVFVVAVWRQIDFHTKSLTPWKALALGPESPFDSIVVDYISDFQFVSLLAAFKRLHIPVVITISGLIISLAATIASTGLFYTGPKDIVDNFSTAATSSFDSAQLDPSILSISTFPNNSVYAYTQVVINGLAPQVGVAPGFAYLIPTLQSSSRPEPANATFTATVDTFVPLITCRAANVTVNGQATIDIVDLPYNSTDQPFGLPTNLTLTINEGDLCASYPRLSFSGLDPLHYIVPSQTLETRSQELFCDSNPSADPILLLTMVEVAYNQDLLTNVTREEGGDLPIALTASRSISRMVNVLCQADYTLSQINVTNNIALEGIAAITLTELPDAKNGSLSGLTSANITQIFSLMLESDHGLFTNTLDENVIRTPAFDLLAWAAGSGRYDDLFDDSTLSDAAQQIYMGAMPDFASRNLVRRTATETASSGPLAVTTWAEERLYTNWAPVIIVITGLGVMSLLTVALIILLPEDVVPRDPNSIAAAATTLTRSVELNRLLKKLQSPRNKGIAAALNGYEVGTAIATEEGSGSRSFKIHITEGRPQRDVQEVIPNSKMWNPLWASLPIFVITFLIPLVLIAVLQVLQDKSDKHQGLTTVPNDRGTLIASRFVPAIVAILAAALINNLDFYIALFSPWAMLHKTNAPATRSIMKNVLGHTAPSAALNAVKARQWGALAATLATVFASLLTVVISGLYLVEDFNTEGPIRSLSRLDNFNLDQITSYSVDNDNRAGAMLNLIQRNYSFPTGTYGEFAFPRVSLLPLDSDIPSGSKLIGGARGTLPGLRGDITCEPPTNYQISTVDAAVHVSASYVLPESCQDGIDTQNSSTLTFSTDFTPAQGQAEFGGKQFDLRFGTNSTQFGHLGEANSSLVGNNPAVGCPSLVFVWGNFELGNDDRSAVNVAICYQKIQNINFNVTMQQNTTEIATKPFRPFGNENSAIAQPNPNGTTDVFDFRIQNNIARQLGDFAGSNVNIDPFFQSMIVGSIVMDVNKFLGNRTLAMMAISHTYRMYMAQVFNAMLREPLSNRNATLQSRQQANVADLRTIITRARLVQDNITKNILHALLALSAIGIMVGYVLTKIRNVLPCNPCSIAGMMSLLAGSDLCYSPDDGVCECCGKIRRSFRSADGRIQVETIHADDNEHADEKVQVIPPEAEWMDDKSFAQIFESRKYSLGWWQPSSKTKRYGVDYGSVPTGSRGGDWYLGRRRDSDNFESFTEQTQHEGRGRTRALSDVNERGAYQRAADPSPGVEAFELRPLDPHGDIGRAQRFGEA
ncbi:hypothetical protein LTR64_003587 [Lithohypha guttulata]|uniref:uncharacterized protein n=1 Tax=Lithohypha guttulata TaxID=1690604 RepID=UPI002DE15008|nr:hypothetical protein LTR51_000193 [Lithohypha guttulata]